MKKIVLSLIALTSCIGMTACGTPQNDNNSHQKRCHDKDKDSDKDNNNNKCDRCCSSADCK